MANELKQRVRDVADEINAVRIPTNNQQCQVHPNLIRHWSEELRAIVAALQQAQQPGAQAVTEELIDEAVNCAWHVAGTTLHSREDIKAAVKAIYPMFVGKIIVAAPPPLPEGVSEEDTLAAEQAFEDAVRAGATSTHAHGEALESYRARIAARGEKGARS